MPQTLQPGLSDAQSAGDAKPKARRRRWFRFALLATLLLLIAGEIGARVLLSLDSRFNVFIGGIKEWDPHRRVRLKSNYHAGDIHTNSKGMLGAEFDARKPPSGYRVAVLGDSCSFLPPKRCYPSVLEELLRKGHPDRPIEVINASCPGYDSTFARIWYEREVDGYEHDALIIYLGWNDMGQYHPDGMPFKMEEGGYLGAPSFAQKALLNCYLLRSAYYLKLRLEQRQPINFSPLSPEDDARYKAFYPLHFEENLKAIIALARSRGREVFLLNFPSLLTEDPTPDEQRRLHFPRGMGQQLRKYLALKAAYETAFAKVVAGGGAPVIDIASLFTTPEERRVFTDSIHFNAEGAERIAEKIAAELAPLIESPPVPPAGD